MSGLLPLTVDRESAVPLYAQLAAQLSQAITAGVLKPGDALENEVHLADRLGLSRPTVRRAISRLDRQGLLVRRRGVGTRVARPIVQPGDQVTSLHDDLTASGRGTSAVVLELTYPVRYGSAARALKCADDAPLVLVRRLRFADGEPLAILTNWLPSRFSDISADELASVGLYKLLRARGQAPVTGHQQIRARPPSGQQRRLLKMTRADAVLLMTRWTLDAAGEPVEYGEHCYRGDKYTFEVAVRP